ncbi:recombinase RecT [Selenomonas sp. AB3002]|uniref:recombinase RecT n=1 Tax=Selenomonas sp. AB3002 TaxID=1392502 RepID=UPI00068D1871
MGNYNNQVQTVNNGVVACETWINSDNIKKRFADVLDKNAAAFLTSLLALVKSNNRLAGCDPKTVISAAMTAATMKLPINPNLGFAYIVPYKNEASFQIGWKGLTQLAMRTGQYKTINAAPVHEGEIEDVDFITGEIIRGKRKSDKIVGYIAYFRLINGFEKTLYMSREEVEAHASKYSMAYGYDKRSGKSNSVWTTNFDAMALKTVLKLIISKYGIMSIDMQGENLARAVEADSAVIREDGTADYVDNSVENPPVDFPGETVEAVMEKPSPAPAPQTEIAFDAGEPEF